MILEEAASIIYNIRKERLYRTSIEHYSGFFFIVPED